ncbi:MAG: PAS domain S-box protein [Flavobacteriales bacterium]
MEVPVGTELAQAYLDLKRQYDDMVSRNLAGIFRTTLEGRFIECNDAMAHLLGYASREELMHHTALDLYHTPEDRDAFLAALHRDRRLINYEMPLKHRNGRPVHVLENVYLDEQEGRAPTILGMLIDVTAYRQAEIEQRSLMASYRSLVEHIRDGLMVVHRGRVRYANPAAEHLVGMPMVGREVSSIFHMDDASKALKLFEQQGTGTIPITLRLGAGPGRELSLFITATLFEGEPATQITLQDQSGQQNLLKERLRVQMAEEVNQVLRQEIAEHRRTQDALRRSRRFAQSLVDSSLDMIMAADPDGLITEYNPAASIRFGYEAAEVLGKSTLMLYAEPEEYIRIQAELDQHGAFAGEVRNIDKEGKIFTSFLAASRLYDEDGQLTGAMGVSRDITRTKQDEEALRASEERYRDLFENATDLIQSVDIEGRFEYVNTAWRNSLGYSEEETRELSVWDVVHPAHRAVCEEFFDRVMRGERPGQIVTVFVTKGGRSVHVEGTTNLRSVDGRPAATRSIFRDITGVMVARQQVQEHEAKLRALFESSEHMFWTADQELKLTSFNRGYGDMIERLYGARPELNTDPSRPRKQFASAEYHAFWEGKYAEAFAGRPLRFETDLLDRNGMRVSNEIFLSPVFGSDGKVTEVFGIGHEITEQKVAEDLVREQAARLQAIFDSSANMMIWTLDNERRITSCNDHFMRSIEHEHGIHFAVGDHFMEAMATRVPPDRVKGLSARYEAAFKGKPQQFEVQLINRHGNPVWVENFLSPILVDGHVQEVSCLAHGITDRKEAQMGLLQSLNEKEVLLKEVHHRVKNNLQVVSSILSLQTGYVGGDERILELLRVSRDRIRSMSFIHESLYQTKDLSSIDLGSYADGLCRNLMMSYSLCGKVVLETEVMNIDLVLDQAIPCGLILNELISNSLKHAFPESNTGHVRIALELAGEQVRITISDDGIGMRPDFDDRRDGNLGLELVHTLVDQLDGRIERQKGRGVTYLLTFERIKQSGHGADKRARSGG